MKTHIRNYLRLSLHYRYSFASDVSQENRLLNSNYCDKLVNIMEDVKYSLYTGQAEFVIKDSEVSLNNDPEKYLRNFLNFGKN